MTRYVEHLADAWAEFWSTDDTSAMSFIYARDAVWWDVARGRGKEITGHAALAAERDAVRAPITRMSSSVVRAIPGDPWVAAEFVTIAGDAGARVAAPGCAWWKIDDDGRITREHWFWEWGRRRSADASIAGSPVAGGAQEHEPRWYRDFAARLMEEWDEDPAGMVDRFYASDVVFDTMGGGSELVIRGALALRSAEQQLADRLVERESKVAEVAGSGALIAFAHFTEARTETGLRRITPATRVLTLDGDDRVVGDHTYLLRAWPARGPR